jgi:hypothetical protein
MSEATKVFISYSWTSPEHADWVLNLATALVADGVEIILDKWDLREGQDPHVFMEQMVTDDDVKKVIIVSDRSYAEKADARERGVGVEAQIMTPQIYNKANQSKFVAIVTEKDEDGEAILPTFYQPRIFIDFTNQDEFPKNYEQLVRWIYDQPQYIKPPVGRKPAFLESKPQPALNTSVQHYRAIEVARSGKNNWHIDVEEYFRAYTENLEKFRLSIQQSEDEHEKIVESIEQFLPYRNEAIELFTTLARYRPEIQTAKSLHRFFEGLLYYIFVQPQESPRTSWDLDNFRFIIQELFIYCIATLIKFEQFDLVTYLLKKEFFTEALRNHGVTMVPFPMIKQETRSLDVRSRKKSRVSIQSDMLETRSKSSGIPFIEIMQADLVLYLRSCMDALSRNDRTYIWWPDTLLYATFGGTKIFEIFARAESREYLQQAGPTFGVKTKDELKPFFHALEERRLRAPSWNFHEISLEHLMNYDKMGTKP